MTWKVPFRTIPYFRPVPAYTTPLFLRNLLPYTHWQLPAQRKEVFLTFDDGPHPGISLQVAQLLAPYNAKATFFCVGENLERYPDTAKALELAGHLLGNHTFHHKSGWKLSASEYLKEAESCEKLLGNKLFRPPYGRITPNQCRTLHNEGYRILMWSFLTYDFSGKLNISQMLDQLERKVQPGWIIVCHDSEKAWPRLQVLLPQLLERLSRAGYTFTALPATF